MDTLIEYEPPKKKLKQDDLISIAIIGSAGRGEDSKKICPKIWEKMNKEAERIIIEDWKLDWNNVHLVSGGAAFADHVAVELFLRCLRQNNKAPLLTLELPCEWNSEKKEFKDTKIYDWRKNPGGTSNYYHKLFSSKIGKKSLVDIHDAIENGAISTVSNGFFDRNNKVSKCDRMIAFTFGQHEPKDGGTSHTWSLSKSSHKKHFKMGAELSFTETVDELSESLRFYEQEIFKSAYNSSDKLIPSFNDLKQRCIAEFGKQPLNKISKDLLEEYSSNIGSEKGKKKEYCDFIAEYHIKRMLIVILGRKIRNHLKKYEYSENKPISSSSKGKEILIEVGRIIRKIVLKKMKFISLESLDRLLTAMKQLLKQTKLLCRGREKCLNDYSKSQMDYDFEESAKLKKYSVIEE